MQGLEGAVKSEQKKVEEALEIYVKILALDSHDVDTLLISGHICVALKKFDDAKDFYKRVLALAPDNPDANRNLNTLNNRRNGASSDRQDSFNDVTVESSNPASVDLKTPGFENQIAGPPMTGSIVVPLDGI